MTYALEIRSTQNWDDVRFRDYTTSKARADNFKAKVKRIDFTDSGHGLVPVVREVPRRKADKITVLADHVRECLTN